MARWQVRKVAGKKTLQIWDDKFKQIVGESPSGNLAAVSAVIATYGSSSAMPYLARPSTSTTNRNHAPTGAPWRAGYKKATGDAICCGCATTARCSLCPSRGRRLASHRSRPLACR